MDKPAAFGSVSDCGIRIDAGVDRDAGPPAAGQPVVVEPWTAGDVLDGDGDERLKQIGRQIAANKTYTTAQSTAHPSSTQKFRIDAGPAQPPAEAPATRPRIPQPTAPPAAPTKPSQASAWFSALLGSLTLGAGLGLLGWALLGGRYDLWNWGLAATLTGQGLMIVGLIQLLATLWTGNRDATNRLITLHYEIRRLQRTTDGIAGARSTGSSSFYADLARGSSPQVLIANLKGQVDELASRYAGE